MQLPLVSIVIPVYNAEKFIAETIISALKQTWPNKEILIVDDGSTDASFTIAKSFESTIVKVFLQPNKGAGTARNTGIKKAQGSYIQFLDADDLLEETKIEKQLLALNFTSDQLAICPVVHFEDKKLHRDFEPSAYEKNFYQSSTNPLDFLLKLYGANDNQACMIALHAWLSPIQLLKKAGFWNENLTVDDDGEYFCRVVLGAEKIICTNETRCYYRKFDHRLSLSARLDLKGFESRFNSIQLKQRHLAQKCNPQLLDNIFASHYWNVATQSYPQYKMLSANAEMEAKKGFYQGKKYSGGPISSLLSKFFGWRLLRYITYFRYGF